MYKHDSGEVTTEVKRLLPKKFAHFIFVAKTTSYKEGICSENSMK